MVIHPVLMIAVPLLAAFLMSLLKKVTKQFTFAILVLNSIFSILLLAKVYNDGMVYEVIAGFSPPVGIYLAVDSLSALLAFIINVFATINFITSDGDHRFSMLYLLAVAGSTGIVLTGDIFNMFVFFEITAVASYALVAAKRDRGAIEGAIKYMILGSVGSVFILMGIAIIYSQLKSLNIYDIASRVSSMDTKMMWISFSLLLTGIGVEAEIFPLNGWVPDVYEGAKSNIASFLSLGPSKAAIYAIARLLIVVFPYNNAYEIALYVGVATLLVGEIAAMMQENTKRMLAYSSIGQMGLILIAFSLARFEYALLAAFFLVVSHASAKSALFLLSKSDGMPGVVGKYTGVIAVLGIIGMPPFAGFWGKWYLLLGAAGQKLWFVIILIFFSGIVEAVYFARYLNRNYSRGGKLPLSYKYAMVILATLSLVFGLITLLHSMAMQNLLGGV